MSAIEYTCEIKKSMNPLETLFTMEHDMFESTRDLIKEHLDNGEPLSLAKLTESVTDDLDDDFGAHWFSEYRVASRLVNQYGRRKALNAYYKTCKDKDYNEYNLLYVIVLPHAIHMAKLYYLAEKRKRYE